jgi:hypothetical protein
MGTVDFAKMLPLYGIWKNLSGNTVAKFSSDSSSDASHGLALLSISIDDGVLECDVQLPNANPNSGAFLIFRATGQHSYYAAGLGGWEGAYTLSEGRNLTMTRLESSGNISNLVSGRTYHLRVSLEGQRVIISIDGVTVIDYNRLLANTGTGLGFFAFRGTGEALFGPMNIDDRRPNAFIAMQFSDHYNEVYRDAIRPLVAEIGYEPFRVDEVAGPGIILNDIWNNITEASVVIAEVSEANPNVYYEIGVAHALRKPTVLLAQRGTKLPFDLGPHRCIFYDNSIPGRQRLLDALRSSLISLLGLPITRTPGTSPSPSGAPMAA